MTNIFSELICEGVKLGDRTFTLDYENFIPLMMVESQGLMYKRT